MYQYGTVTYMYNNGQYSPYVLLYLTGSRTSAMSCDNREILLIDDNPAHASALEEGLIAFGRPHAKVEWSKTLPGGLKRLKHQGVCAIFLNLFLPGGRGVTTLDEVLSVTFAIPVIVLAGLDDDAICKTAMLHGAHDYILEGHIDSYSF